ncbi:MAG: hypothetical protein V2A79_03635 [Planctomycetota bacterium]
MGTQHATLTTQHAARGRPRAVILVVVLLILALLGLSAACFVFQMNAEYAATRAEVEQMQTRLAAEAGFHYVTLLLREHLQDVDAWFDNPEKLRRVVVWSATGGLSTFGEVEPESDKPSAPGTFAPAYRFTIVGDDPGSDFKVRYGITDESAKLNINTATADQLTRLLTQVVPPEVRVEVLVDSLLDWRDQDEVTRPNGAESDHYRQLNVPYRCKSAPFETVEELLMVRGFTGQVLYGEDADRNGLLSPNEDDGETTFPPDNGDGVLNRGLYPYITVHSRDFNKAADNKPRVVLSGSSPETQARLEEFFSAQEATYLLSRASSQRGTSPVKSLTAFLDIGPPESTSQPASTNGTGGQASTNGPPDSSGGAAGGSSPFTLDDFPRIVDRCTLKASPELPGLININTAPPVVLRSLGALAEEDIAAIVQRRATLSAETKQTPAWLLTQGVLDKTKYDAIADFVTARGLQFTVETVGYGDHIGARTRLQIIFGMRGPVPQIMYYRDLTSLGVTYPLRRDEEEQWSKMGDGVG